MAKLDDKYQKMLDSVNGFLNEMENVGVFPIKDPISGEECKKETFVQQIEILKKEKFTIATCGSVKAGKSTFLNNLLFGKDVLPYSDVPCTAKLTFISHTDDAPYFEVFFYNKEEFADIRKTLERENCVAFEELKKRVATSFQNGVSFSDVEGTSYKSSRTRKLDELFKKLEEFVATNGPKTPFVKEVHIYINRQELANIDIVDTPGLNDPNPLNSHETIKYAKNAHALIYLMGWKGPDQRDMDFLKNSFGMAESEGVTNRVFIISHIDKNPEWVDTKKEFEKNFPGEKIYGVSAYISLLQKKRDDGYTLTEDESFELEELENSGFEPDRDNVAEKIADLLYKKEGAIRIHRVKETLTKCLDWKLDVLKNEINRLSKSIEDGTKSAEKLNKEIENITKVQNTLEGKIKGFEQNLIDQLSDWLFNSKKDVECLCGMAIQKAWRCIEGYNGVKMSKARFPDDVSNAVRSTRLGIIPKLCALNEVYKACYKDIKKELERLYAENSAEEILTVPEVTSFANYFNSEVDKISLIDVKMPDLGKLIGYFRFDSTNNEILKAEASRIIKECIDEKIGKSIEKIVISMQDSLMQYTAKLRTEVESTRTEKRKKLNQDKTEKEKQKEFEITERDKITNDILPALTRLLSNLNDVTVFGG
jgi:chaperonin cofactor prefoldin